MSRIVTFYSFKGGVGRTFALANIAVLLAQKGKKVLLIDWDLEAPGLERYFSTYRTAPSDKDRGTIHLLCEACTNTATDWRQHVEEVQLPNGTFINLIPSGASAASYSERVHNFSWSNFFDDHEGGLLLENWRTEWKREYDFILLDSRTGITDTGGVCTILLPDFLVLVCATNEQNFAGALAVAQAAQHGRRSSEVQRPPLTVLPLLGRFDGREELDEAQKWLVAFGDKFKPFFDDWLPSKYHPQKIVELTKIPYVAKYSFGEPLAVLEQSLSDPYGPGYYLRNCAQIIDGHFQDAEKIIDPAASNELSIVNDVSTVLTEFLSGKTTADQLSLLVSRAEMDLAGTEEFINLMVNVGRAFQLRANFSKAENYFRKALSTSETLYGSNNINSARPLNELALLLLRINRWREAEPLLRHALEINERNYGPDHPEVAVGLNNLAQLLADTNRLQEAEPLMRRALEIAERNYGPDHPDVATDLNNLAQLLADTNRLQEAEPLMRRALEITERSYGPDHPDVATQLNNLAMLLKDTNRPQEAEPLLRRALHIDEGCHGPDHPDVATDLNNLALLLQSTNRLQEAEPLMRRNLMILSAFKNATGHEHPHFRIAESNYRQLLEQINLPLEEINLRLRSIHN